MNIGAMKSRITIQRMLDGRNSFGELETDKTANWEDVVTVWAEIRAVKGHEYFSQQRDNLVTHKIFIRARAGLSPKMRAVYKGSVYRIVSILPWDDRTGLTLMCEERVL